ncbi:MAG: glycosyltransferase family 4 protein [Candidatus Palauibacterales bacterium]|nr:glycosyltransferase family 4 protein [Candidatus Palauibacterales bacterium]MDP2530194.1 glycosyltransferase family 4 protein [Candidatus Palauibacterales bacterium]MDP2584579.1 glycosyltransferase family 4 protein [Candidatus Palauibacterales bacterium]
MVNWQDRRNPQAGGAEVHLHETFGRLAAAGHRITLLVSGWRGAVPRESLDGMDVCRAGGRHSFPLVVRGAYRRLRRERSFDLVVENINKLPLLTPLWMDEPVVALVNHLFGPTAFREAAWPVAAVVWSAERLIPRAYRDVPFHAVSESTAEDLIRRGIARNHIEVIPGGIDHALFRPNPSVERFPRPTFVYVGRLKRYKGLEVVFEALARLERSGVEAHLLVAGTGDDRSRLESAARDLAVETHVRFLGYVSEEEKVELLRRAWATVYPSPREGWGLTNIEAAACGTPTVASDAPGLRESVLDGRTGFLVPHADAEAWAERMARLCTDAACRSTLSEGAIRHAARFSWERTADRTAAALRSIVEVRATDGSEHRDEHEG